MLQYIMIGKYADPTYHRLDTKTIEFSIIFQLGKTQTPIRSFFEIEIERSNREWNRSPKFC